MNAGHNINIGSNLEYLTTIAAGYVEKTDEFAALKSSADALRNEPRLYERLLSFEKKQESAYNSGDQRLLAECGDEFKKMSSIRRFGDYFACSDAFAALMDAFVSSLREKVTKLL